MIDTSVQKFDAATLQDMVGPRVRAAILADTAKTLLAETDALNAVALGGDVLQSTMVDGSTTDNIDRVRPEGTIIRTYGVMPAVLAQIGDWLWQHSPVRTGRYQQSHSLLADGAEIAEVTGADWTLPPRLPEAKQFSFVSTASYAPLLEPHDGGPGESPHAPDGVYQVIAALASDAFSELAAISFDTINAEPAIVIEPR